MKIIGITGGTGFVGAYLVRLLRKSGYKVVIFTRSPEKHAPEEGITYAYWSPLENKCDLVALKTVNAVVHLAGAGVADKRWTEKRKKEIETSRVNGTAFMVGKLKEFAPDCEVFVAASAIGYYGPDRNNTPFTEDCEPYNDFLGETCVKWESEAQKAREMLRTVILRFGIVLGKDGGVYKELVRPMRFGVAARLGNGNQVMSWIHAHDLSRMIHTAIEHQRMSGVYNAVAPNPVPQKLLVKTLAEKNGGKKLQFAVPAAALKVLLGEMSTEVLKSCTVSAGKISDTGFTFQYPTIDKALDAIIADKHSR